MGMSEMNNKSMNPKSPLASLAIYARPEIIWFEVFVAAALILAMEVKAVHRFVSYAGPASNSRTLDLFLTLPYPLMLAGLAAITFFSLRRLLSAVAEGPIILRIVAFQGLLLLNMALLGMSLMRF